MRELLEEPDKDSKKIMRDHLPELKYKVISLKNRSKFIVDLKTRNNWTQETAAKQEQQKEELLQSMASSKKKINKASFKIVPSTSHDIVEELDRDMKTDDLYANRGKFDHLVKLLNKDIDTIKARKDCFNQYKYNYRGNLNPTRKYLSEQNMAQLRFKNRKLLSMWDEQFKMERKNNKKQPNYLAKNCYNISNLDTKFDI